MQCQELPIRPGCTEQAEVFGVWDGGGPFHYCAHCWGQIKSLFDNIAGQYDTEYRFVDEDEAIVADIMWR